MDIKNDKTIQALLQIIAKRFVKAETGEAFDKDIKLLFDEVDRLEERIDEIQGVETYEGEYEITPAFSAKTLDTKGLLMSDDVVVNPITVSLTSNEAGGKTLYIGEIKT